MGYLQVQISEGVDATDFKEFQKFDAEKQNYEEKFLKYPTLFRISPGEAEGGRVHLSRAWIYHMHGTLWGPVL